MKTGSGEKMRVVILGAGASICAGYPPAEDLLRKLKEDAKHVGLELRDAWDVWAEVVASAPEEVHPLLTARNPEIVLSFLDLCKMFLDENFTAVSPAWLSNASTAKNSLIHLLGDYFMWKHVEDSQHTDRRAYMREMLRDLKAGDAVVTFNWDTVVERSLLELGRWNPTDGYGFIKSFRDASDIDDFNGPAHPLAEPLPKQSEIRVLKLHGSVGWRRGSRDELLFDNDYLNHLLPEPLQCMVDADIRKFRNSLRPLLAYPSFLKQLDNRIILNIWQQAHEALGRAKEVEIFGYSLPPSDSAARGLLLPLRSRGISGDARIAVHNPKPDHLKRFHQFFDGKASCDERRLC
jgi:hypothetical protein